MTIDEAISHAEEVAEEQEKSCEVYGSLKKHHPNIYERLTAENNEKECAKRAADHRQLAEWLTDYKELKNSIGAVKLSNMKEALALIRTLKAELNGWQENPFAIIAEACGAVTDCRRCQWYKKCPKNYGSYPSEWRNENET